MAPVRRFSPTTPLVVFAVLATASAATPALAQQAQKGTGAVARQGPSLATRTAGAVRLKEPTEFRVYQRDQNGKADIPIVLDGSVKDGKVVERDPGVGHRKRQDRCSTRPSPSSPACRWEARTGSSAR